MIRKVRVENFKSVSELTLELGRVNVLIGANGSGKSNILEAIAFAAAASQDKLDSEFLISRGMRVTETRFMSSAFHHANAGSNHPDTGSNVSGATTPKEKHKVKISIEGEKGNDFQCELLPDETTTYPKWTRRLVLSLTEFFPALMDEIVQAKNPRMSDELNRELEKRLLGHVGQRLGTIPHFLLYCPENSALRTFQAEGQILPLGIRGEGLFAHLKALNSDKHRDRLMQIKDRLRLIDWFETFDIPDDLSPGERSIRIRDQFLPEGTSFDQRSANEGFLYLLFYITLFVSPETPAFFAIDNIDSSLNPKLCTALLQQLVLLAKEHDKQVIVTTHNPAVLDGLDLHDEEQRLFVVDRNKLGHTRVRRIDPPKVNAGELPVSLSEAFMRGYIGGLPKNF